MLFYVQSDLSDCIVNIETVEKLIWDRFQVYCSLTNLQYDTDEFNKNDRLAHLLMTFIAIDFPPFKESYLNGEMKIFREKLKIFDYELIKNELCTAIKYLNDLSQSEVIQRVNPMLIDELSLAENIVSTILNKSSHVLKKYHSDKCRKFKMKIPFTFPLQLVAKRVVEVRNGKACVSCGDWNKILEVVFNYMLHLKMSLIKNSKIYKKVVYESEDDRLRQIIRRFTDFVTGYVSQTRFNIKAEEIDEESRYFPPCMANLHQILRHTHRLSYDSRYQYTLYLKDIGLSVEDNILFWENEYSKPHIGSSCTHEWEEKEKRYTYQIQHIYGLIGSHGLKTSHSCDKFINILQNKMNSGCPFQHMTKEELENAIPKNIMKLPDVEDIFKFKSCDMPQKACAAYLQCQLKLLRRNFSTVNFDENKFFYIVSPIYYYNMAKQCLGSRMEDIM